MLTQTQYNETAAKLRKFVPIKSKIRYDSIDRCWEVKYEEGEWLVVDCYKLTANRGFVRFSTIKTEI
jgi:hypothetical protein